MWLAVIGLFVIQGITAYKFPEKFQKCHLSDANISKCLDKAILDAMHLMSKAAIPSSRLPLLDPVFAEQIDIGAGTQAVQLTQKYNDVKLYGLSDVKISKSHMDMENKKLSFSAYFKNLTQASKYEMKGRIIVFPVTGKGDSVTTILRVDATNTIDFKETHKSGKRYFEVLKYTLKLAVEDASFEFTNLFDGNEDLAAPLLKTLNDNSKLIFEDIKGGIEEAFGNIYEQISGTIFNNTPIDEIFLP